MAFCNNCGQQANEGDRFCQFCGAPFQGNQSNANTNQTVISIPAINTSDFKVYFNEIGSTLKAMLTAPVSTVTERISKISRNSSIIIFIFFSFFFALLSLLTVNSLMSNFFKRISPLAGLLDSSLSGLGSELIGSKLPSLATFVPKGKVFFFALLIFILSIALTFAIGLLFGKLIFKTETNTTDIFKVCILSSIPFMIFFILQYLLSFISFTLGIASVTVGIIISLICLHRGLSKVLNLSENKMTYIIPIIVLAIAFVDYLLIIQLMKSIISLIMNNYSQLLKNFF